MNRCTATLTTATVEPCTYTGPESFCVPMSSTQNMVCNGVTHVKLHTLTCTRGVLSECDGDHVLDEGVFIVEWIDDTPGAKPHKPPLVTDEEVEAAFDVLCERGGLHTKETLRAALEAAARKRREMEQAND